MGAEPPHDQPLLRLLPESRPKPPYGHHGSSAAREAQSRLVRRRALPYLSNRLLPVLPHSWIGRTTVIPNTTVQLAEQVSEAFIASQPTLPVGLKESPHGIERHQFVQCWQKVASPRWSFSHMTSLAPRMNGCNGE